jgi:hypothetical protein
MDEAVRLPRLHRVVELPNRNSTNRPKNFPAGFALPKQATGFELTKRLRLTFDAPDFGPV